MADEVLYSSLFICIVCFVQKLFVYSQSLWRCACFCVLRSRKSLTIVQREKKAWKSDNNEDIQQTHPIDSQYKFYLRLFTSFLLLLLENVDCLIAGKVCGSLITNFINFQLH